MMVSAAQMLQIFGTAIAFMGEQLFVAMGINGHPLANNILDNRMGLLGVSFMISSLAQNMASTGAFEIYLQGDLIFSKLESKRMPTIEEIIVALASHGLEVPTQFAAQVRAPQHA